jgi:cysteinyl-tRNA synthetase
MPDYGMLSGRKLDEQKAGARVAVEAHKKNPADFVLWKQSSEDEPGWESPWGRGRPGWHIECSAMSEAYLGEVFDIHGGGLDLIFPHHENELAQSRCAHGTSKMANYWMHNGFLQVEGAKMSKSEGNFVTIHDLLETKEFGGRKWEGQELRLAMLKTHYRQPIDWTQQSLEEAARTLDGWKKIVEGVRGEPTAAVCDALSDDLNTPLAITELFRLSRAKDATSLAGSLNLLGLNLDQYKSPLEKAVAGAHVKHDAIEAAIVARTAARARKDFKESDRIRNELATMGIVIKDGKDPATGEPTTTWEIAR